MQSLSKIGYINGYDNQRKIIAIARLINRK